MQNQLLSQLADQYFHDFYFKAYPHLSLCQLQQYSWPLRSCRLLFSCLSLAQLGQRVGAE